MINNNNLSYWTLTLLVGIVVAVSSHFIINQSLDTANETPEDSNESVDIEKETVNTTFPTTTTTEKKRSTFAGNVGSWQAYFDLTFNYTDNSVSGSYFYPNRPDVSYVLKGNFNLESLTLFEYTEGVISAECTLIKTNYEECYKGIMENADGRNFDMKFCKE